VSDIKKEWNANLVRKWLLSRFEAAQAEQVRAMNHRDREDDYDAAAAEEWVLQIVKTNVATDHPDSFARLLNDLLDKNDYRSVGIYDDRRFDRAVRRYLRKLIKMTKANAGFENLSRFQ